MGEQVVVIGLGRFGASVATNLYHLGHDVLAIDINEKAVQEVVAGVTYAVTVDARDEAALRQLGVLNYKFGVVGIGSDVESSLMVTLALKKMGVRRVTSRAKNEVHAEMLKKVGADRVVFPAQEAGLKLAHSLFYLVKDYLVVTETYGISEVEVTDDLGIDLTGNPQADETRRVGGKTVGEMKLELRDRYSLATIAIRRGNEFIFTPDHSVGVEAGDILLLGGKDEELGRFGHVQGSGKVEGKKGSGPGQRK